MCRGEGREGVEGCEGDQIMCRGDGRKGVEGSEVKLRVACKLRAVRQQIKSLAEAMVAKEWRVGRSS